MFQYRMCILKEWKLLMRDKRVIMMCLLFPLFFPLLNLLAALPNSVAFFGNPMIPIHILMPFYFILTGMISCELTLNIMNKEFETKCYDILVASQIDKRLIILSKITLPVLLGSGMILLSILFNHYLQKLTALDVFVIELTLEYTLFFTLFLIFGSLLNMLLIELKQKRLSREEGTYIAGIVIFGSLTPLYGLYYYQPKVGIIVLMMASISMFFLCLMGLHQNRAVVKRKKKSNLKFNKLKNRRLILIKASYCHYWSHMKSLLFLSLVCIIAIGCTYGQALSGGIVYSLLPIINYFIVCHQIVFQSTMFERKVQGILQMKLAKLTAFEFIFYRLSYAFGLNFLCATIFQVILLRNLINPNWTLFYLAMNLFVCLFVLGFSLVERDSQFKEQDLLLVFLIGMGISIGLIYYNQSILLIVLLIVVLYFICSIIYKRLY